MIDPYDLYCVNTELKEINKALNVFNCNVLKETKELLQLQIDWIDGKCIDEGICPFCGGDIEEKYRFYEDTGKEVKYECSKCGQTF